MAMFGAIPGGLSANPDWLKQFQAQQPQPEPPLGQQPMGAAPPQTSGMFGAPQENYGPVKGTTAEKLMALGGIFSQLGGVRNDAVQQYFATLDGRREEQRKAQLAEAARFAPQHIGDNIVRMNPQTGQYDTVYSAPTKPVNNDTENDYNYILKTLGPAAATQFLKNFAAGTPVIVRNPDGTITPISRDAFTNGSGGQPPSTLPPDFDFGDGGPKPSASGTFPDWRGAPGTMTSGRRTVEGNRLVGGVANSGHLRGDKADYVGTTAAALRSYYGPSAKILDERTHLDVSLPGYGRFPYYGKRGTTGLK